MIDTNKIVPDGFILLQTQNGTPKYAACMTGRLAGWLMKKYPDGNWVSERKLTNLEVMQAEDQRDDGIVHETPAATIQAAPEEVARLRTVQSIGFKLTAALCQIASVRKGGIDYVPREAVMDVVVDWRNKHDEAGKVARLAATIQEPVMVAEPADNADQAASFMRPIGPFEWREFAGSVYAAMRAFDGTWGKSSNEMRRKSLEDKAKRLMRARTDAAPMVADPAGVAGPWVVRERRDKETGKLLDCFVEAPKEGNMAYALEVLGDDYSGYGNVERKLEHCKLIVSSVNASLAATVKAVPSEARDTKLLDALGNESWNLECFDMPTGGDDADIGWRVVGHYMAEPIRRIVAEVYEDNPRAAIKAALAAPLADKTGGGE